MKSKLLTLIGMIFLFSSGIIVGALLVEIKFISLSDEISNFVVLNAIPLDNESIEISKECVNNSVGSFSYCLRDYVNSFYNYSIRNGLANDIWDLKSNGGDCSDYSIIYCEMAREAGFNSRHISFYGEDSGHRIALIWDDELTEYCIIDLHSVNCVSFKVQ